jgi:hypothetical protein
MQITPMPGASWSNAAAAQQATNEPRSATQTTGSLGVARPTIGDIERSAETLDRDANGQYTSDQSGRQPSPDGDDGNSGKEGGQSILDLPAIGQTSELDLLG